MAYQAEVERLKWVKRDDLPWTTRIGTPIPERHFWKIMRLTDQ
jgi:hypothetical protein